MNAPAPHGNSERGLRGMGFPRGDAYRRQEIAKELTRGNRLIGMARIVQKFGGTSVADVDRIKNAALKVKAAVDRGNEVVVVVSAMSGVTNSLVELTQKMGPLPDGREYDAVVATGEQTNAGLMALALQALGIQARSWMGWQIPIHTDGVHGKARITG
ncbi:MAG: aspartokinase, partial [Rhodospirillales bacterium]|nr:aspartokinase [Rhodospirillales bacterium]